MPNPWNTVSIGNPPMDTPLWGYDVYSGAVKLVIWYGGRNDDMEASLTILDNPHDDDNYFRYWKKASIPRPPKDVD